MKLEQEQLTQDRFEITINGKVFKPQKNITPYELSKIMVIILCGQFNQIPKNYIEENGLERHFV